MVMILALGPPASSWSRAQVETVESSSSPNYAWVSHGRVEGHLALKFSSAGAFSQDSTTLAVASEDKVVLLGLRDATVVKPLRPHLQGLSDLDIQSANYLSPTRVLLFATGIIGAQGKEKARVTPLLVFQWNLQDDTLFGIVNAVTPAGGIGRAIYFPQIFHLGIYQESRFEFWDAGSGRKEWVKVPNLTRAPNLYGISPDGRWMLLAQVEGNSSSDPIVVRLRDGQLVETLPGHLGTVLSMSFARDSTKVVTTCEDGNVRVYSVPDWKLVATLTGHQGPVHWAEFSPDGKRIASAGEDGKVRIWSAAEGKLEQTLSESKAPVLTVAFSPNSEYVAATSEQTVFVWQRVPGN
jgi:WD40 repeat protein